MDGFIDKYAQRKNAQEMIRANAMAEAEEKEKMASRLSEYETAMQEMRRCNLQTLENVEKVKELLAAGFDRIEEVQKKAEGPDQRSEELIREMRSLSEELRNRIAELEKRQEELVSSAEDFNHKEAVKVYRNVQAVIESALPKQTDEITDAVKNATAGKGISVGLKIMWALTLAAALANAAIEGLRLLGYL